MDWITARDGSRAAGDVEDQAARYHPGRHELTINGDFRVITDLITHGKKGPLNTGNTQGACAAAPSSRPGMV